jgi:hypothetical protein
MAASGLVDRTRKTAAMAQIEDPSSRALMERYHAALSTAWGPGELVSALGACGVTDLHGTDYGDPGEPLSTLLREGADEIDRAEANRHLQSIEGCDVTAAEPLPATDHSPTVLPLIMRMTASMVIRCYTRAIWS